MKEIIAMHGWGSDSNRWQPWVNVFKEDGWQWQSAERGYGDIAPYMPIWINNDKENTSNKSVVICHSLGFHLTNPQTFKNATHVVLLSSFSRFIPNGKEGRSVKTALQGMKQALGSSREKEMFLNFLTKASNPDSIHSIKANPLTNGLSISGRKKLQNDLQLLINTNGLAPGIPPNAQVLVVNGQYDNILSSATIKNLAKDLITHLQIPPTEWTIMNEGHALLNMQLITKVKEWLS